MRKQNNYISVYSKKNRLVLTVNHQVKYRQLSVSTVNRINYNQSLLVFILFFASSFFFPNSLVGQEVEEELELNLLEESLFVGGLSPVILTREQIEVNVYSSLFSSWLALHESVIESPVRDRLRLTEFTTNAEAYYGFSKSGRWDLGFRLRFGQRRLDNEARSSVFKVFDLEETQNIGTDKTYSGTKEIGVRFRVLPLKNIPQLSMNAGYSFGKFTNSRDDGVYRISDRNSLDLNLAYYVSLNESRSSLYYFILNGTAFMPGTLPENKEWLYNTSGSFFIVQRFGRVVLYPGLSYTLTFKEPSSGSFSEASLIRSGQQLLGTVGLQFQPSANFSFNVGASVPLLLTTTNLRQRLVRESYSLVSVGFRLILSQGSSSSQRYY